MDREQITQIIRKAIAERGAKSPAERQKVYEAARKALGRRNGGSSGVSAAMEAAIGAIEASYAAGPPAMTAGKPARRGDMRSLLPFAAGVLLGAFVMGAGIWALGPTTSGDSQTAEALERQYRDSLPQIPVAVEYLRSVSDAIVRLQKSDRAGLEDKAAKKFVQLKVIDPELAKEIPASLPPGSSVIVRANGFDFKILFNWPLCGAVRIARPELVDHVRSKADVLGCPYFGMWTPAAANW
jgi:hypothetical protein